MKLKHILWLFVSSALLVGCGVAETPANPNSTSQPILEESGEEFEDLSDLFGQE